MPALVLAKTPCVDAATWASLIPLASGHGSPSAEPNRVHEAPSKRAIPTPFVASPVAAQTTPSGPTATDHEPAASSWTAPNEAHDVPSKCVIPTSDPTQTDPS